MGKIPYSTPQLNPNPKTKPKKKQFNTVHNRHADESPAVTQTASDDAYSFNQMPLETISHTGFNLGECINFNVSSYSRSELKELRKRFVSELDRIRTINNQIEVGQLQSRSNGKVKKLSGSKRPVPLPLVKDHKQDQKLVCQTLDNGNLSGGCENGSGNLMKMCRQVLTKLMKHKNGWIFNKPVDASALGLHDYHQIIKRPMDLGTVKSNFSKSLYTSPIDFAADVRLTFNNAMLYNPKTDGVHIMASELLDWFENMFRPISQKFHNTSGRDNRKNLVSDELQGSSWNDTSSVPAPPEPKERVKKPKPSPLPPNSNPINPPISKQNERLQNKSSFANPPPPLNPQPLPSPVRTLSPAQSLQPQPQPVKTSGGSRGVTVKQPKPRAKDPNKREMSDEEKQKLGLGLQSLPQEKMPQLVQIIKKRNENLAQDGDEIELDIEALDTETLWELDRFVTNWKKLVSKTKRQALMGNYSTAPSMTADDELPSSERVDMGNRQKKGGEDAEEDVDIGDEMEIPENNFPSLELVVDKDEVGQVPPVPVPVPVPGPGHNGNRSNGSSSSSSTGSDSSSSSDSDSGSSSGSDSDADEAQS